MIGLQIRPAVWPAFTFESNGSGGRGEARHPRRAARGAGFRRAGDWRGRGRHDLRVMGIGQIKPLPMTHLERGIVPQRALGARRQAKLRGELSEAAGYTNELICVRARPAQVVDRLSPDAVQVHKPHEEGAVCVQKRREMRRVEPGCMLPDLPHDTAHAFVAPADSARWCP
jgi:hypothetical protein